MKKQVKFSNYFRTGLAVTALAGGLGVTDITPAFAAGTYTWSGAAGDHLFSTAGNWAEASAPTDGAALVFPCVTGAPTQQIALTNDLTGVKVAALNTPPGPEGCGGSFKIDTIDFITTASVNGSRYNSAYVSVDTITGVSNLSHNASWTDLNIKQGNTPYVLNSLTVTEDACGYESFRGLQPANLTLGDGSAMWPSAGPAVTVQPNGRLGIGYATSDVTVSNNITFEQGSAIGSTHVCWGGVGVAASNATVLMTGDIVLNGDVTYELGANVTLKITGNLSGSGKFVAGANNEGILNIAATSNTSGSHNGVTDGATAKEVTYGDDKSTQSEIVIRNTTATLDGSRGRVVVDEGGVLNGNGTADSLNVAGTVAPGHSPGKITVVNMFQLQATGGYSAEILNASAYDQIAAGGVSLDPAGKLQLTLLPGAVIKKSDKFTIISNTGATPVSGTFAGLAEGAQVVVSGETFTISYVGGDGNDVVLTAMNDLNVPGTPNTGVGQVFSNPIAVAVSGIAAFGALTYLFKRK